MVKDEKDEKKKAKPKQAKPKEVPKVAEAPRQEPPKEEKPAVAVKEEAKAPEAPKPRKKKKAAKKETKAFVARGKRKTSVARAAIIAGKGVIRINSRNLESYSNPFVKEIIREPLRYMGPEANSVDISVSVVGGGTMGQAQAARTAIANALSKYFDQMNLRQKFVEIDRSLVIEDTRRVESKKFRGPKARARFQKSYR